MFLGLVPCQNGLFPARSLISPEVLLPKVLIFLGFVKQLGLTQELAPSITHSSCYTEDSHVSMVCSLPEASSPQRVLLPKVLIFLGFVP
jgi:hypothetical protein